MFSDVGSVNAIWMQDTPETAPDRNLILRSSNDEQHYNVVLPQPISALDIQVRQEGDLLVSVNADQTIDMVSLWVMRGNSEQWSSSGHSESLQAKGTSLRAVVPKAVLASCGNACEVYLQFAHVWQDDSVFSLSEVKHKLL